MQGRRQGDAGKASRGPHGRKVGFSPDQPANQLLPSYISAHNHRGGVGSGWGLGPFRAGLGFWLGLFGGIPVGGWGRRQVHAADVTEFYKT